MIRRPVFSPAKHGFESVISMFCCSVSVGNISLHFQSFILPLIVIISEIFVCSVCKQQTKETKSRRTVAMSPRCFKRST